MENITFTTSGGHPIELRPFITGRQKRHIMGAFLDDVELKNVGGEQSFSVQGNKANIAQDRAIEAVVISVDAKTDKVLDLVLDLPGADYDEVIAKMDDITGDKKKEQSTPKT